MLQLEALESYCYGSGWKLALDRRERGEGKSASRMTKDREFIEM